MLAELDLKVAPSQFAPLLEREEEKKMFRIAMEFGKVKLSDQFRSSPQTLLSGCLKGSFIPSRFLPAVCALDRDGGISLTPLGKIVQRLVRQLEREGVEAFFVLTSGAAKETAAGAKPYAKTRTLKNGSLRIQDYDLNFGRPRMDGDILVISPDLSGEMIKELSEKLPTYEGLEIKFRESRSRPISMIKVNGVIPENVFDWHWRERRFSVGQISAPEFRAENDFQIPFIAHVFSQDTNSRFILLVPTETKEGFVGVEMDFFSDSRGCRCSFWQRSPQRDWHQRTLKIAFFPYFEESFPVNYSYPEAFAHYCHFLRDVTWDNCLRLACRPEDLKNFDSFEKVVDEISSLTSLRFAKEVIYPIAQNSSLIVDSPKSMLHQTNRLIEAMENLLNGDPFLGLVYLLSAGENPTQSPAYGTGVIDERGFFPKLYDFLHKGNRLLELSAKMETCDWGAARLGWPTFVNYIYRQTGKDLRLVDELLCPTFCSNKIFPTLIDNYARKALARFYPTPMRDPSTGVFPKY